MRGPDPSAATLWLQFSGLPAELNKARANAWLVFRTLVEIDAERPSAAGLASPDGAFEVALADLAERCGLEPDPLVKILETLRKRKVIRLFLPEAPEEPALVGIVAPLPVPLPLGQIAPRLQNPHARDVAAWRYAHAPQAAPADERAVQHVLDLYLNHLSQRVNAFVVEQAEVAVARFPLPAIERMIERAARHNVRTLGWVIKELIREERTQRQANKA